MHRYPGLPQYPAILKQSPGAVPNHRRQDIPFSLGGVVAGFVTRSMIFRGAPESAGAESSGVLCEGGIASGGMPFGDAET